jgi:archaellum component FlaC
VRPQGRVEWEVVIYLDPRVIEGSLYSLDNNTKYNLIMSTMNGLELSVLENRLKTTVEELQNLSVKFNTFKHDLEHSLTQHLHP